jgi:cytochrome b561
LTNIGAPASYTRTAITLHWLIAIAVLGMLGAGFYMIDMRISPDKLKIYMLHKSVGLSILALMLFRIIWRLTHRPPALPGSVPSWQRFASHASHALLYVLLLAMPLSGWLMNSASGFPTKLFGVLPLPQLIEKSQSDFAFWQYSHAVIAFSLCALIAIHVLAALKHHFIDKDVILRRMLGRSSV